MDNVNNFELRNIVLKSIENKELEMAFNNKATYVLKEIIETEPGVKHRKSSCLQGFANTIKTTSIRIFSISIRLHSLKLGLDIVKWQT